MYTLGINVRDTTPYGLLILRVVLGAAFLVHGWSKLSGGVDNVAGFFGGLGVPAAGVVAWLVTIVELVGGFLLIIGALTQIVGILLAIVVLGAIVFAYIAQGSPVVDRGAIAWEKEAVFAAAALCLTLAGPGIWAVDDMLAERQPQTA
jgi:putative oxidoreductase